MRDTCNQSVKKEEGRRCSSGLGEGEEKKQMLQKRKKRKIKKIFKERDGVGNPGEGAAGTLVFLGINVTDLLPDRRTQRTNEQRGMFFFLHFPLPLFFTSVVLKCASG